MNNENNNLWKKIADFFLGLREDHRPEEEYDGR